MSAFTTHLKKLTLKNFRCFSDLEMDFHEQMTVISAPNGGGKTALLDAISLGWRCFLEGFELADIHGGFAQDDVRKALSVDGSMQPILPVSVSGETLLVESDVGWKISGTIPRTNLRMDYDLGDIRARGSKLRQETQEHAEGKTMDCPTLPILGYYGTGRLWAPQRLTEGRKKQVKPDTSRTGGYNLCLSPNSRFNLFEVWFGRMSLDALNSDLWKEESIHNPKERLQAVRDAVNILLQPTQWSDLSYDSNIESLSAYHPEYGKLPVSFLSDGIRIIIGLVGDMAHRCTRLNPHLRRDAARNTPGVVMIDEVDMHLHPEWQQLVLPKLMEAFPKVQFIITTHSPQVLTTVKRENIRILVQGDGGDWTAEMPPEETKGTESSTALNVMGVNQIPPVPEANWRNEYTALIENGATNTPEANKLRDKLDSHFGAGHPIMLDFERLIRFQEFKLRRKPAANGVS